MHMTFVDGAMFAIFIFQPSIRGHIMLTRRRSEFNFGFVIPLISWFDSREVHVQLFSVNVLCVLDTHTSDIIVR